MFSALRIAARPATRQLLSSSSRSSAVAKNAHRMISTTPRVASGAPAPQLYGTGSKAGEIPTDELQATGLERLQLMGEMENIPAFDTAPLDSSRVGTLQDPIKVPSLDVERVVGCTGSPADSHELHWFTVKKDKIKRCVECGSAYALDFQGQEHHDDHHDTHHH